MREATAARLYEKFLQTGLMLLTLGIPIGCLAFLESRGVVPGASVTLLISSSLMMVLVALLSVSKPVAYLFWVYALLLAIWVVSFDLRTSDDLIGYLDGRSIEFSNLGENGPGKLEFIIYEKEPGTAKDPKPIMKAEKLQNESLLRNRAKELGKNGHIVAENGLWLLYVKQSDFIDRNRILKRSGLGKDHIERVLNAFIFW